MCSENLMTVPFTTLHSHFESEVPQAYLESVKLLRAKIAGFPALSVDQFFQALHGSQYRWGSFSTLPQTQTVSAVKNGSLYNDQDNCCYATPVDAHNITPHKKLASSKNHRFSTDLINSLPDELLCQVFRFLHIARDRVACASVSKRWLMLQSRMPRDSFLVQGGKKCDVVSGRVVPHEDGHVFDDNDDEKNLQWKRGMGNLSRCLSGRKASDVRLAAIAVGIGSRGGLGKLCIRGGAASGLEVGVTDVGLSAIGTWCSGLRVLSLWNCLNIKDEGLSTIAKGCRMLEKVDLFKCPLLADLGLESIAKNCSHLSSLNLDGCGQVGNKALAAFRGHCSTLSSLSVKNCPQVGDDGLIPVVCLLNKLKVLKLAGLQITDKSLAAIGWHSKALVWLSLDRLDLITVGGFINFSVAPVMRSLKQFQVLSCKNFSDLAFTKLGSCGGLKHVVLSKCDGITDEGLADFVQSACYLQVLQLENCHAITGTGLVAALSRRGGNLKEIHVKKCEGICNVEPFSPTFHPSHSHRLDSISLTDCPGAGDLFLALLGLLCPEATTLDLTGLSDITDDGLFAFLCASGKLKSVRVSGCVRLTDRAIGAIACQCGPSLKSFFLDGCENVSDRALQVMASYCSFLEDLDISGCRVSDEGLELLLNTTGHTLSSLNLSGCIGITDKVLPIIHKHCDGLLDLNLNNCGGLSDMALAAFQARMWNCTVLY